MLIALDFDDTVTLDPLLWEQFVLLAKKRKHDVAIVTRRRETDDNGDISAFCKKVGIAVVYASMAQKSTVFSPDVWIDDMPLCIPSFEAMKSVC